MVMQNIDPKRWRINGVFLGCAVLGLVFGTAAITKIQGFHNFESTIVASNIVPMWWAKLVAAIIVSLEVVLTFFLFIPVFRVQSLQLFAVMISTFISYSVWRGIQNIPLPCHCFGALFTMTPVQSVLLNLGLLSLVAYLLACSEPNKTKVVNSTTTGMI